MIAVQTPHPVVSHEEWRTARLAHLAAEKQLTQMRDELSRQRRALPWERVEQDYVFEGINGTETLADLFAGHNQLIVYHFMMGPTWEEGCRSCSLLADHLDGMTTHLAHRDVRLAVVSRAPMWRIAAFQKRMDWRFHWVSAYANTFQRDYGVHFTKEELAGEVEYNYHRMRFALEEAPGLSVFFKNTEGEVFHTYSTYARGLDALMGTYQFLDLVPKGRDEEGLAFPMAWVRHHDKYADSYLVNPQTGYQQPRETGADCRCGERG